MSQLFEALRRAGRDGSARQTTDQVRSIPDAILASKGQGAQRQRRTKWWLALLALSFAVVIAFSWSGLRAGRSPAPTRITDQAAARPRRSPAPAPETPAAAPAPPSSESAKPTQVEAKQTPRVAPPQARGTRQFARALTLQRAGDLPGALSVYRTLFNDSSLAAAARNNAGLIHQQRGELLDAQRAFERAIDRWPQYARAHNNLGVVLLAGGRTEEAASRFRRAAELDPRDPDPRVNLALTYKAEGRLEEAKEVLLQALVLSPESAAAHYNLAVVYDHAGEHGRAVEHYRSFLEHSGAEYAARAVDVRARIDALDRTR